MLLPCQEIYKVTINTDQTRNNLIVTVTGTENHCYVIGDYFPETKQVQFYGARLTKKQINKIFELISKDFTN
jgi:hypothetical protein